MGNIYRLTVEFLFFFILQMKNRNINISVKRLAACYQRGVAERMTNFFHVFFFKYFIKLQSPKILFFTLKHGFIILKGRKSIIVKRILDIDSTKLSNSVSPCKQCGPIYTAGLH